MEQNVGSSDKLLRTAFGAIAGIVSLAILANFVSAPAALSPVLGLVAIIMLVTGTMGTCPIYSLLGVNSCSRGSRPS
jgi:ammonia channel protein AmtB